MHLGDLITEFPIGFDFHLKVGRTLRGYPRAGMALAMGTHRRWPDQWLVNGVIRMTETTQGQLL